jgi:hypothetical protein
MKENAAIQSARSGARTKRIKRGAAADPMDAAFESVSGSLRSAGLAKSKTRNLDRPKRSDRRQ